MNRRSWFASAIASIVGMWGFKAKACEAELIEGIDYEIMPERLILRDGGPHDLYILAGSDVAKRAFLTCYYEFQEKGRHIGLCVESTLNDEYSRFADFGASEYAMKNCGFPIKIIVDSKEELENTHQARMGGMSHLPWRHVRVNVAKNCIAETPGEGIEAWREIAIWSESPRRFSEKYPDPKLYSRIGTRWNGKGKPIVDGTRTTGKAYWYGDERDV